MTETPEQPDIVEIDGKQYSRAMALQMARDIEYVVGKGKSGAWGIDHNSALMIGAGTYASFAIPVLHAYMVDGTDASAIVKEYVEEYEDGRRSKAHQHMRWLQIPPDKYSILPELRSAHELAIDAALTYSTKCNGWQRHDFELTGTLGSIVGRSMPEPAYADELRMLRAQKSSTNPSFTSEAPRFWKISPGGGGTYWPVFRERSLIAVRWAKESADLANYPDGHAEFIERAKAELDVSSQGARGLWDFAKVMRPGDKVLAYANQQVVGYGEVTGDYALADDDFEYMHRRSVEWESTEPRPIAGLAPELQKRLSTQATLFELTREQFLEATGQDNDSVALPETPKQLRNIRDLFAASGLHYTHNQVATFVTALQTKGFVVLSGISGTGKSKIATGFVEMLPGGVASPEADGAVSDGLVLTIRPYMIYRHRVFLPKRFHDEFPPMGYGDGYNVDIDLDGTVGTGRLTFRKRSSGEDELYLNFHKSLYPALGNWSDGDKRRVEIEEDNASGRVTTIRFGQVNAEPGQAVAYSPSLTRSANESSNHLFLSVRPDWRDSTSLLGYYNPLTQTYEWTDFLKFVIQAGNNYRGAEGDRIAWFVILDEMNLAHVEYYFADLLSVLESGRDSDGWTREPLRTTYPDSLQHKLENGEYEGELPEHEIRLPPNLYIIGTVNMDETTHAFSPKVLDRAFTIELTDVDFEHYAITGQAGEASLSEDEKRALLGAFSRGRKFARIDKAEAAEAVGRHPKIRTYLQSLNELLRQNRMHFGYRVFDEIAMYLAVNDENGMMPFEEAFDQAVFMKVLPKFTGSLARLRSPMHKVLAWAIDPLRTSTANVNEAGNQVNLYIQGKAESAWTSEPRFPVVATRVRDMLVTLETDGFVSFG